MVILYQNQKKLDGSTRRRRLTLLQRHLTPCRRRRFDLGGFLSSCRLARRGLHLIWRFCLYCVRRLRARVRVVLLGIRTADILVSRADGFSPFWRGAVYKNGRIITAVCLLYCILFKVAAWCNGDWYTLLLYTGHGYYLDG